MPWFDIADGRLRFAGRITGEPIREWLASAEGTAAVQAAAAGIRFSLFGRSRSARRQMRRRLRQALAAPSVRETVAAECARYVDAWTPLAYAPSLPRVNIGLQRVVVVPRVMIVWRAASPTTARLAESLQTADVPDPFRAFFATWVVGRMDDAIRRARPSPERPLYAQQPWACVALYGDVVWIDPLLSGTDWQGHVVMFEMPAARLQRRDRRELTATIEELTQSLPNLSRLQRDKTVRIAMDQMASASR